MAREQPKMPGLGAALRFLRARSGLHQQQVADVVGKARSSIGYWEKGRHDPCPANLELYLKALGCTLCDLEHALREVRGEEAGGKPPNGEPPPDFEGVRDDARDLVDREVDRRLARIMMYMRGHDPEQPAAGDQDATDVYEARR